MNLLRSLLVCTLRSVARLQPRSLPTPQCSDALLLLQALTIGVLGVAGVLRFYNADPNYKPEPDHSWARILEAEEREKSRAQRELETAREKYRASTPATQAA